MSAAEASDELTEALTTAADALKAGDFGRAAKLAGAVASEVGGALSPRLEASSPPRVARQDRAETWRIFGLALFFEGDLVKAEAALLEYLKLDADARLDPALIPPEAIVFLEDVRSRYADEIRGYHPEPTAWRWRALNLIPPAGQFQNGDRRKGSWLAVSGVALIGANLGSYARLSRICDAESGCRPYSQARLLRSVNVASLVGLGALYVYGVYDGFSGYRRSGRSLSITLGPSAAPGIAVYGRF